MIGLIFVGFFFIFYFVGIIYELQIVRAVSNIALELLRIKRWLIKLILKEIFFVFFFAFHENISF